MSVPGRLLAVLLRGYEERFVNRHDTFAVQHPSGRYARARRPLDVEVLREHLEGQQTLALYAPDRVGRSRWLCFDCDTTDGQEQLLVVQHALHELGVPSLREASRRGGHLWILCEEPHSAALLRRLGRGLAVLLQARRAVSAKLEIYPDVDAVVGDGVGHAVRAPLGIHQLTGRVYPFVDAAGHPCYVQGIGEALSWLLAQPRLGRGRLLAAVQVVESQVEEALDAAIAEAAAVLLETEQQGGGRGQGRTRQLQLLPAMSPAPGQGNGADASLGDDEPAEPSRSNRRSLIAVANSQLALPELIARARPDVGLRPAGHGWIGWCPFHDDDSPQANGRPGTPSLYVVENRRHGWSWRCLSSNCGAAAGPMHHAFDWLFWCSAGDMRRALAWTRRLVEGRDEPSDEHLLAAPYRAATDGEEAGEHEHE
jgi:hypothetical protein